MNDQNAWMAVLLACLCKRGLGSGLFARGTAQLDSDFLSHALALSGLSLLANGFSFNFNVALSPGAVAPALAPAPALAAARSSYVVPQQFQAAPRPETQPCQSNWTSILPMLLCCCLNDSGVTDYLKTRQNDQAA